MKPRHDLLSSQLAFNLNWIPHRANPGLLAFAYVLVRATVLAWACLMLPYLVRYAWTDELDFSHAEVIGFTLCFIVFEEQSRWLYLDAAGRKAKAALLFFLCIVEFEFLVFYLSATVELVDYLWLRAGSVVVHAVGGLLALAAVERAWPSKYALFAVAVAFHLWMNLHGAPALAGAVSA